MGYSVKTAGNALLHLRIVMGLAIFSRVLIIVLSVRDGRLLYVILIQLISYHCKVSGFYFYDVTEFQKLQRILKMVMLHDVLLGRFLQSLCFGVSHLNF